jgi:hypothetical protein
MSRRTRGVIHCVLIRVEIVLKALRLLSIAQSSCFEVRFLWYSLVKAMRARGLL